MTAQPPVLEFQVVQQRPCSPSFGACMVVEISRRSALQFPNKHVCNDARARQARSEVHTMSVEARRQGFAGEITVYFPPGTFGEHVANALGQLAPRGVERPPPRPK